MFKILGVLLPDAAKPRFRPCRFWANRCAEHVKDAMLAAGADAEAFAQEELSPSAFDIILFAAEHTPCIERPFRTGRSRAVDGSCALVSKQGVPLAFALPAKQLEAFDEDDHHDASDGRIRR